MPVLTSTPQIDGTCGRLASQSYGSTWESMQDATSGAYDSESGFIMKSYELSFQDRKELYRNFLRFTWPSSIPTNAIIKRMVLKIRIYIIDTGTPNRNDWEYLEEWNSSYKLVAGTNTDSSWPGTAIFNDLDRTKITDTVNTDVLDLMKYTRYPWSKFQATAWAANTGYEGYDYWQYQCINGPYAVNEELTPDTFSSCYIDGGDPWIKLEIDGTLLTEMKTRFAAWNGTSTDYANLPNFVILSKADYIEHDDSDFLPPPITAGEYDAPQIVQAYSSDTSGKEPILEITYSTENDRKFDTSGGTSHIGSDAEIII